MTLNRLVLPAPFGPITAVTCPFATATDTSDSAAIPPKASEIFSIVKRSGIGMHLIPAAPPLPPGEAQSILLGAAKITLHAAYIIPPGSGRQFMIKVGDAEIIRIEELMVLEPAATFAGF